MVADRENDGRYTPTVDDDEILAAVESNSPAATAEVAAAIGLTRQATDYRLRQLRDRGEINSKKIGASLVWYRDPAAERVEHVEKTDSDPAEAGSPAATPREATVKPPDHEAIVAAIELEGSGSALDARRAALVEILDYLRDEGSATASELKALVDDDDPRLYTDANSYWANIRRQKVFDEIDIVETPGRGGKTYYYQS